MALVLVVEDGTGLEAANVYDLPAAAEVFLTDRGYPVFAAGSSPDQDLWQLDATEAMEREMLRWVTGGPINGDDQSMLHPRVGSVDRRFRLYDSDERPLPHREGIFLLGEDVAVLAGQGKRLTDPDSSARIQSHSEGATSKSITYATQPTQRGLLGFKDRFPAAFLRAREAYPDGRRATRA